MKVFRVQYTVRSDFVEENKKNTEAVMRELRTLNKEDLRYAQYLHEDGKTFMHLVHYNTAEAENVLTALQSFKHFRARLDGQLEVPPKSEAFQLVQSSAAKGLRWLRRVPSGGEGASQSPAVEVWRAVRRKAARHPGSRQALDIIEPFHSAKILA